MKRINEDYEVESNKKEWVCKPSSVPAVSDRRRSSDLTGPASPQWASQDPPKLQRSKRGLLPAGSSDLPAVNTRAEYQKTSRSFLSACLVLQAVGFALPAPSPMPRCALTAPFHHCLRHRRVGCVFSVALSRGLPRVAVSHHRALSCSDFPPPPFCFAKTKQRGRPPDPLFIYFLITAIL